MYTPQQNPYSWTQPPPQPPQGWWGRNWKWFVPTGCLGLILLLVAGGFAIIWLALSMIKSSDVYRNAVEQAKANPEVVSQLGEPIEEGWYVKGNVRDSGGVGFADLEIPISGPEKSGTIYAVAMRDGSAGEWKYTQLQVGIDGLDGRVQILNPLLPPDLSTLEGDEDEADDAPPVVGVPPGQTANAPVKTISGGVLNGKATSLPKPTYPPLARTARASGTVTVQVVIDETGKVIDARAVSGHPLLQPAAVQAARQARFSPTLLSGKPVRVSGVLTYNFVAE